MMTEIITKTRIQPPRLRPDVVSRARVLESYQSLLNSRLVLVIAPAGYGKTLSLIDLVHHIDAPVCWYSVGQTDYEPHRFIVEYFIAALERQFSGLGNETRSVLQGYTSGSATLEQVVITLTNELHSVVEEDIVFVIDDFHLAGDTSDVSRFLSQFIQQSDERCHLIVASRTLLDLPDMALMVARGQVAGFDFESLAFAPEEAAGHWHCATMGVELSEDTAAEMGCFHGRVDHRPAVVGLCTALAEGQPVASGARFGRFPLQLSSPNRCWISSLRTFESFSCARPSWKRST